jgi:hypothetical protein
LVGRLFQAIASSQSDAPLLLTPGIGQGLGEAGDREVRRRGSINDRRNDARPQEGKGGEQADVPFALDLTLSNLGKGSNAAEPVDPSSSLGDGGEKRQLALTLRSTPGCGAARRELSGSPAFMIAWELVTQSEGCALR